MKKLIKILGISSMLLIFAYCAKDEAIQIEEEQQTQTIEEVIQELFSKQYTRAQLDSVTNYFIKSYNYTMKDFDVSPYGIVLQKDIGLPIDDILNEIRSHNHSTSRSYHFNNPKYLVNKTTSVRFAILDQDNYRLHNFWETSLNEAVKRYNKFDDNLKFSKRRYSKFLNRNNFVWVLPYNFTKARNLDNRALAEVIGFREGYPAQFIFINTAHPNYSRVRLTNKVRKYIMEHEITHVLGFYHAGSNQGYRITGLSDDCQNGNVDDSVMRPGYFDSDNFDWTECDIEVYQDFY